jgi:hypothetical protein
MGWLSRVVHGWASVGAGHPTIDSSAEVREQIGSSRTTSSHRDLPTDTIEWRWDGERWARWSALSRRHDRTDLPVPESLQEQFDHEPPPAGATYRLSGDTWVDAGSRDA